MKQSQFKVGDYYQYRKGPIIKIVEPLPGRKYYSYEVWWKWQSNGKWSDESRVFYDDRNFRKDCKKVPKLKVKLLFGGDL